jgi:hypothetical protein
MGIPDGQGLRERAMVAEQDIRIRSYLLWEVAGRPKGRDLEFWLRAKADLEAEARFEPRSWARQILAIVPRVPICPRPQRSIAMRIPPREYKTVANAAKR